MWQRSVDKALGVGCGYLKWLLGRLGAPLVALRQLRNQIRQKAVVGLQIETELVPVLLVGQDTSIELLERVARVVHDS